MNAPDQITLWRSNPRDSWHVVDPHLPMLPVDVEKATYRLLREPTDEEVDRALDAFLSGYPRGGVAVPLSKNEQRDGIARALRAARGGNG